VNKEASPGVLGQHVKLHMFGCSLLPHSEEAKKHSTQWVQEQYIWYFNKLFVPN